MSIPLNDMSFANNTSATGSVEERDASYSQDAFTAPAEVSDYKHLAGKRVGLVVLSSYPWDPRPRRAAEALVQQGMSVDFICLTDGKAPWREKSNGMNIFRIPITRRRGGLFAYAYEYSAFILASAAILAARSLRHRYDLIYVNNMPDILVVSALFPKMLGAKVILDQHDPMPELMATIFNSPPTSKRLRLIKWLEKWSLKRADQVLTPNIACKRIFGARSCPSEKLSVVMNTPDENIFHYRSAQQSMVLGNKADRPFVLMYHGSLVERNGADLAVEAFASIRSKLPLKAQLHIYGKATPFLEQVMGSVRDLGLQDCVLYKGQQPLENIVKGINACDVGLIPNQRSAFADINTPTRIFEYLSLGRPVIVPRTPGIQDYFPQDSIFFFEVGSASDLAKQIAFVASHPKEVLSVTERGQQVYRAHSWKQEKHALVSLVDKLLSFNG